jgi:hypothetical protein
MMNPLVLDEMRTLHLGDARRNRRLCTFLSAVWDCPSTSIPVACDSASDLKGAYRLLSNEHVEPAKILRAHAESAIGRIGTEDMVLLIQDTMDLQPARPQAMERKSGFNAAGKHGVKVHSVLMTTPAGSPLGVMDQQTRIRPASERGKSDARHSRPISEKESQRWIDAEVTVASQLPESVRYVMIADRESDIFAYITHPRRPGASLLIRICQNRRSEGAYPYLFDAIGALPVLGSYGFKVYRGPKREARDAELTVQAGTVDICPPRNGKTTGPRQPARVQIVVAEERNAPEKVDPIRWVLLTTLPVSTYEDARQCIEWYGRRWLIEIFHHTLKSGCKVEQLQLEAIEPLSSALAVFSIVAWRVLALTYAARINPTESCEVLLERHEWKALDCLVHRTTIPQSNPPSLAEAVAWIAKLGGYLGRKNDKPPGVKALWIGLQRLEGAAIMFRMLRPEN